MSSGKCMVLFSILRRGTTQTIPTYHSWLCCALPEVPDCPNPTSVDTPRRGESLVGEAWRNAPPVFSNKVCSSNWMSVSPSRKWRYKTSLRPAPMPMITQLVTHWCGEKQCVYDRNLANQVGIVIRYTCSTLHDHFRFQRNVMISWYFMQLSWLAIYMFCSSLWMVVHWK